MRAELPVLPEVTLSEADGVRTLHLETPWVQGAMRIRQPGVVVLDYVQRMLAALLWRPGTGLGQGKAVQLGLGAGALTRFTLHALRLPTTVVEVNPAVIAANHRWFHLPLVHPRLTVVEADAGAWLGAADPGTAQLLQVDLYDHEAAAPVLDDAGFYASCHRLLDDGGVLAVNLFGRDNTFAVSAARIAEAFGVDRVWAMRATREGNTIVIATRGLPWPGASEARLRAEALEARFGARGLAARKWPRMVRPWLALPA